MLSKLIVKLFRSSSDGTFWIISEYKAMNCKLFRNNQWISLLLPLLHNTILASSLTNSFVECKFCVFNNYTFSQNI